MGKQNLLYTVYFVGDGFMDKPYSESIWAESSQDAAMKFFDKHPKEYECQIQTGDDVFAVSELFPKREFVFLERELVNKGSKLNFNKLDQHSKDILFEIYKQFPEWLSYAKNDSGWKERFNIEWQSPHTENLTMWVSTAWADYEDLAVGFNGGSIQMLYDHPELITLKSWILEANEYLNKIKNEKIIYYEKQALLFRYSGLCTPFELTTFVNVKKVYSWLGTYNYPKLN